jgi:hypothetical protein
VIFDEFDQLAASHLVCLAVLPAQRSRFLSQLLDVPASKRRVAAGTLRLAHAVLRLSGAMVLLRSRSVVVRHRLFV